MSTILDEAGNALLDEALGQLYDEAGAPPGEEGTSMTAPTAMAATHLSQTPVSTPVPAAVDAVNGNISGNTGATIFRLKNSDSAATHTVTFDTIVVEDGLTLEDLVITIPESGDVEISGLQTEYFGANVTWLASDGTHVTVSVVEPA